MDVYSIRQQLKTKSIYDIPLRVTFYARVSSEKDEQLNSLDNQISYYRDFINNICPVRHMNFTRNYRWVNGHEKQFTYSFRLVV